MNDSLWTFLFEMANFVALAAVLAWLFFKPVRKALEDQRAKAIRQEQEATEKLAAAERLRQQIESQRESLATELDTMRIQARETAKRESEQLINEARAHMRRERAIRKRDALHIEQAQMAKIARAVAVAAHGTMQRFLQQMEGPELETFLIKAACRELKSLSNNALAPVTIESAKPLEEGARKLIDSSLGEVAKTVVYRVDANLIGGLRISTAHGLVDASIAGLANYAERSLSAEMESMIREESNNE